MAFHDRRIEPPRYWEAFEDLCLDLYREVWSDPSAQKNGRAGQAQAGTDVYGQPDYAAGKWHGVQCKGKDTYNQGEVTETELRNEVEKAKTFKPALSDWILATTAKKRRENRRGRPAYFRTTCRHRVILGPCARLGGPSIADRELPRRYR